MHPSAQPVPTGTAKVDLWGPPLVGGVEGFATQAPRKKKAWGALDTVWGLLGIIGAQLIIVPFLMLLAIAQYNIRMDEPGAVLTLMDSLEKVVMTGPGIVLALMSQWVVFVGFPLLASYRKGHRSLAKDFGLHFKVSDFHNGLILAVGMQALMFAISWLLHQTSLNLSDADNTNQVTDHVGIMLVIMIIGATIGAPLTEELFFRGLLLRGYLRKFARVDLAPVLPGVTDHLHEKTVSETRRKVGVVCAVLLSSVIFGMMHLQMDTGPNGEVVMNAGHWVVVAQTGLLGLIFAVVAVKTRRIGLPIVAHFFFNSASIALVLLTAANG